MKKFFYLLGIASLLLSGCYKDEINELQKEMDDLENIEIASLQDQVKKVTASIGTLEGLSAELKEYINKLTEASAALKGDIDAVNQKLVQVETTLQAEIDNNKAEIINRLESAKSSLERQLTDVNTVLSNLQEKSAALEQRIADLKTYADNTYADKTWVEGTFATLEAQNALIEDIEAVKANILTLTSSIAQIEANVRTMVGEKLAELTSSLEGQLQDAVLKVTEGYTAAIAAAKDDVTSAYTAEIASKISDSETGIKNWITDQLKAYYTVSAAEAQIAVFQALLGNVPQGKSLQEEIDQLIVDFGTTKESIIETYKQIISEKIEAKASELSSALQQKVDEINTTISGLQLNYNELSAKVSDLLGRMGTLEGEMEEAQAELERLEGLLTELQTSFSSFIEGYSGTNLATIVAELQKKIDECASGIATNTANISELTKTITTLQENIQTLLDLEKQLTTAQTNITSLQAFINGYGEGKDFTTLSALVTYLEGLIEKCAKASDLDKLEAIVGDANSGLVKQVDDLNTSLTNINSAIDAINTFIGPQESGATLASLLAALQTKIDECLNKETTISGDISALLARIEVIEGYAEEIEDLGERITAAESDIDSIKAFLEDKPDGTLKQLLEGIQAQIDALTTAGETAQQNIQTMIDAIKAILYGTGEGNTPEDPAEGTLMYRITQLENQLVAGKFQSIAFVPTIQDGSAIMSPTIEGEGKDAKVVKYSGTFNFLVRPADIAGLLTNAFDLRWVSTPETKTVTDYGYAFSDVTIKEFNKTTGVFVVLAEITNDHSNFELFEGGASAALFVNIPKSETTPAIEFTSKFIPISVPSDKVSPSESYWQFPCMKVNPGDLTKEITITTKGPGPKKIEYCSLKEQKDGSWIGGKDDWLKMEYADNDKKLTFTAKENTSIESRLETVVIRFKKDQIISITLSQEAFSHKFTKIEYGTSKEEKDLKELTAEKDNKRYLPYSAAESTWILKVTTNDNEKKWKVVTTGMAKWLTIDETELELGYLSVKAAEKEEKNPDIRSTEFYLESATGDKCVIVATQSNTEQNLTFKKKDGSVIDIKNDIEISPSGETIEIDVEGDPAGNDWTVSGGSELTWFSWEKIETSTRAYVKVKAIANTDVNRQVTLDFRSNTGKEYALTFTQAKDEEVIVVKTKKILISSDGTQFKRDDDDWAVIPDDGFREEITYGGNYDDWSLEYTKGLGTISWKTHTTTDTETHKGPHKSTQNNKTYVVTKAEANKTDKVKTCTIYIYSKTKKYTETIEVEQQAYVPLTGVSLNKTEIYLAIGSSYTLVPTVNPTNASVSSITWFSNKKQVVVSRDGKVTVNEDIPTGSATITCTAKDIYNKEVSATCTVKMVVAATSVSISPTSATVGIGSTTTLTATVSPNNATDKSVTWSSSDNSIATVDENGVVTGVKVGFATITCTANGGKDVKNTCSVTVKDVYSKVTGSTVDPNKDYLVVFDTQETKKVFNKTVSEGKGGATDITIGNDGTIASTGTINGYAVKFIKHSTDNTYAIQVGTKYLSALRSGSGRSTQTITLLSDSPVYHTIAYSNSVLKISCKCSDGTTVCLCYDTDNSAFRYTAENNYNKDKKMAISLYAK